MHFGGGSRKPFGILIALTAKIGDPAATQESEVALYARFHRPAGEIAIFLPVSLAVQDIGLYPFEGEVGGDVRHSLVVDRRHDRGAIGAVECLFHADVVHVVMLDAGREQLADDFRE